MDRKKYNGNQNKNKAFMMKAVVCLVGICILAWIASTYRNYIVKEGKAPYLTVNEIIPQLQAFSEVLGIEAYDEFQAATDESEADYVTVKDIKAILSGFPNVDSSVLKDYKRDSWYIGVTDWNVILTDMVKQYGGESIFVAELTLFGDETNITDENGLVLAPNQVLTDRSVMEATYWNTDIYLYSNVIAVCYDKEILSVLGYAGQPGKLHNVYLSNVSEKEVHFFTDGYHMKYGVQNGNGITIGMVVDLTFEKGKVEISEKKTEFIHGKLLQISDEGIEIEGYGIFEPDEDMKIYRLYSELKSMEEKDLRIGYSFTDFVMEDGKIAACLMIKEEDMEYIRVLLKNSDYAGRYHEVFTAVCDQDYEVIYYRNGIEGKREEKSGGETFELSAGDLEVGAERIKLLPKVLSARTTIESIGRSQGVPVYPGTVEITAAKEGLLLVNEVLLEDYLCKVVPSEMPSSYPKEALMSQAICARTYAYGKMMKSGLPALGAHVDDSAGFQVYNNIKEQAATTEAVKATHNMVAEYEGEPIGAYYYSTSCGVGSDTSVWHGGGENPGYLMPQVISSEEKSEAGQGAEGSLSAYDLANEDNFRDWILNADTSHYESQEGWYRWTYTVDEIDTAYLEEILQKRYENNPKLILTQNSEGEFVSQEIDSIGEIEDIAVTKRLPGGVADELTITGSDAVIKVVSELNIRYVLANGVAKVQRQSGDEVNASATLPSAFVIIDLEKEEEIVKGYRITGGGFGHGVGMSQNGAKNMAQTGKTCEEILMFFYPGAEIKTLQFKE